MTNEATVGHDAPDLLTALKALRNGDFSARLSADTQAGTDPEVARTFNELAEMLGVLVPEVRRVAREVGVEGKFGPQAEVPNVAGEWQALVSDVNEMAANLTCQVRDFARITTAVANGDLTKKVTVDAAGEIAEWKATVNIMVDQVNHFASELTRLVRAIGTQGALGGQMEVRGVAGTWKDLIANVNQMSADLTAQLRGITQRAEGTAEAASAKALAGKIQGEVKQLHSAVESLLSRLPDAETR